MIARLAMATCHPELLYEALRESVPRCGIVRPRILIVDNGAGVDMRTALYAAGECLISMNVEKTNVGHVPALQKMYISAKEWDANEPDSVIVYAHDDFHFLEDGWLKSIADHFEAHPNCVLAGPGGAKGMGSHLIYKSQYRLDQLGRSVYLSNTEDAELHGARCGTPQLAATLDGMSLAVRRSFLDSLDGWNFWPFLHHGYDNAISCEARRARKETWLLPFKSRHLGGRTVSTQTYRDVIAPQGGEGVLFEKVHRELYDRYRDVLPFKVPLGAAARRQDRMRIPLQKWISAQIVGDEMRWKGAFGHQMMFLRDELLPIIGKGVEWKSASENIAYVISTHRSKSIVLPVVSYDRPDIGLRLVVRNNFYNWKLSVISEKPIDDSSFGLFFHTTPPIAPDYSGNELAKCYFEGFPDDLIFDYHVKNPKRWSAEIWGDYPMWATVFLIMRQAGAIKPREWHTRESHKKAMFEEMNGVSLPSLADP